MIAVSSVAGKFGTPAAHRLLPRQACRRRLVRRAARRGGGGLRHPRDERAAGLRAHADRRQRACRPTGPRAARPTPTSTQAWRRQEVAARVLEGLAAGEPEIVIARGMEAQLVEWRRTDPAKLFAVMAKEGARLAEARATAGGGAFTPEGARLA